MNQTIAPLFDCDFLLNTIKKKNKKNIAQAFAHRSATGSADGGPSDGVVPGVHCRHAVPGCACDAVADAQLWPPNMVRNCSQLQRA